MEQTSIFDAARLGDVNLLHQLLKQNPFALSDYLLLNSHHLENPIVIATKANHPSFVRETLKVRPELAVELNQEGLRPLDVASAYGNVEIVGEMLKCKGPEICRMSGRDGRIAIHFAVVNGRVEIVEKLLKYCLDCVGDVTGFGESVLHLAVRDFKLESLKFMLGWIKSHGMMEMVNWKDKEGNTVLHYAISRMQLETVQLLLEWNKASGEKKLEVNAVNSKGLTPLDILDILIDSSPSTHDIIHIGDMLRRSGGCPASEIPLVSEIIAPKPDLAHGSTTQNKDDPIPPLNKKTKGWKDRVRRFLFKWHRHSPDEVREALLVVAALIATITFQAGINPPSYLFVEPSANTNVTINSNTSNPISNHTEIVYAVSNSTYRAHPRYGSLTSITVFLVSNSLALSTSISIIAFCMAGMPFQRELLVSLSGMIFGYGWSMANTKPTGLVKDILLSVALVAPLLLRFVPYVVREFKKRMQ